MNFKEILEYQQYDGQIRKQIKNKINSESYARAVKRKTECEAVAKKLEAVDKEADSYISEIKEINKSVLLCANKIKEFSEEFSSASDERKAQLFGELMQMKAKLEKAERKLEERIKKIKMLGDEGIKIAEQKDKLINEYSKAKKDYDNYCAAEINPKIDQLTADKKKMEGSIDPSLLEMYNQRVKEKAKFPYFHALSKDKPSCICGMALSQTAITEISEKGYCQCENDGCHRILFFLES